MKRFVRCLMLFAALSVGWATNAQSLSEYIFSTGVDSTRWVNLTNYTDLSSGGSGDYWSSAVTNIGFTFPFGENDYTQFSVNSDGNLRLGPVSTISNYYSLPFAGYNASNNTPKINFFGCDGYLVSGTHYVHTQTFGDTMLVVEFCLGPYNSTYRNQQFLWQVQLCANGNIQVVFAPTQGTNSSNTHQMGLCVDATEGWVINSSNEAIFFTNGSNIQWNSTAWPSGNYYCFNRPVYACSPIRSVQVSNIDNNTATASWTLRDSTQTNFLVAYGLGTDTDEYTQVSVTGTSYTMTGLLPGYDYNVRVKAVCTADDQSFWSDLAPFSTLLCAQSNMCPVIVNMNDSYGDGWNGGYLTFEDSQTGGVIHTCRLSSGSSATDTVYVCNLRYYNIVWHSGNFNTEVSFTVYDNLNNTIFTASAPQNGVIHTFSRICFTPDCWPVQNLTVDESLDYSATISWTTMDLTQDSFVVAYGTGFVPDSLTQMTVTGTTVTLTGLDLSTTYYVFVKSVCGANGQSDWGVPVSFTTTSCPISEMCYVYMSLSGSYGSNWGTGYFALVEAASRDTVHYFRYEHNDDPTWDSAHVCNGQVYSFVWIPSGSIYHDIYANAIVYDINGDTLFAANSLTEPLSISFIPNCTYYSCRRLQNVFVDEVTNTSVNLHWTLIDSTQTDFVVAYGIGSDPDSMTQMAVTGTSATITGLSSGTNYDIYVKPVCSVDEHGPWTHVVGATNPCADADMCYVYVDKASTWGGWASYRLALVDSVNGSTFREIEFTDYDLYETTDSVPICPNRTYHLQVSGAYWHPDDFSFAIRDYLGLPICNSEFFTADTMLKVRTTCEPPTCWPVHDVRVASYDNHNATITWDLYDTTQTNFVVAYGIGNNPDSLTQVSTATNSALLTGLDSATAYRVYVKAVCGSNDHSNWSEATTFTTSMCPASEMCYIYLELINSIPEDWGPIDGGYGMWLIDSLTGETVQPVKMKELAERVYDSLYVCVGRTYLLEFPTDYYAVGVTDSGFASYASMTVTNVAGEEIHTFNFDQSGYIPSISFVADCSIPSCQLVSNVTVSNVEDSTAALTWELRDTTQTNFVVAYGTGTNPDSLTQALVATNSYMLSGLTPATRYNVYVKALCSDIESSSWSPIRSFTTAACASAEMCKIYVSVSQGTDQDWMSFHPLALTDSLTGIVAHVFNLNEMCTTTLIDSAMVCPGRVYTFFWEGDYAGTGSVITVTNNVGEVIDTAHFSFYSRYDYSSSFTSSCDIPTCLVVRDVAVSNVDTGSATVSWSLRDPAQTSFVVAYGTSTNPDSLIQAAVTTTSYQLSGLAPGTQYYVFVKAVCSGIDHSNWSPAASFTTPMCAVEDQCAITVYQTDDMEDGWNGGYIAIVDSVTGITTATVSLLSGQADTQVVSVCPDRVYNLVWHESLFDDEVGFVVVDFLGDTVYSEHNPNIGFLHSFTAVCDATPQTGVSVFVAVNDPAMGTTNPAPGVYNYAVNDTLVATALPAPGYHFVEWVISLDNGSFTDPTPTISQPIYFFMEGQTINVTATFEQDTPSVDTNEFCNVTVVMHDSYGDGWNGSSWLKFVDNATNTVADSVKLTDGSLDTAYVSVIGGHSYSLVWTTGNFDYENSFEVYDILGLNIYSCSSPSAGTLHTFTAVCSIPSCMPVIGLVTNYTGGTTANVSWSLVDSTQSNFVVAYGDGTNPDSLTQITTTTPSATLTGLSMAIACNVFVRAVCGNDYSEWSSPATFVTDLCLAEDQCMVYAQLADSYGDGWNNAHLLLVDSLTGGVAHDFTLTSGSSLTDSAAVCPGRVYNLVWSSGLYDSETSFALADIARTVLFSDSYPTAGVLYSFTANCTLPQCPTVQSVSVSNITTSSADVSWTLRDTTQTDFVVAYGTGTNPDSLTQVSVTGTSTTLTGLSSATIYNVFVKAVCGSDNSDWSPATFFVTSYCLPEDQCSVSLLMADIYADTWNGGHLSLVDSLTGIIVHNFEMSNGVYNETDSAVVCIDRTYSLYWNGGYYDNEVSFSLVSAYGDTLYSDQDPEDGFIFTFTASCVAPVVPEATVILAVNDSTMGTTTPAPGTYTFHEGDTMSATAVASEGYHFVSWTISIGFNTFTDSNAVLTQVVSSAMLDQTITVTANFEQDEPMFCNVTVVMHDSYGDGWNGSSWLKFVDNATNTVADSVKLTDGSLDTAYVSVIGGHSYSLVWATGSYDYENSFEVYDILGRNIYSGSSLTAGTLHTFTAVCSIPSCMPVIGVAVNYSGGTTANVSWSLVDSTQSNFVVAYGTGTNPDSLTQITATTTSATITGLSLGTGYNVFVRAVCGSDYGDWSTPAYFVTDLCLAEDQCMVYAQLTDSYGDGWNNAHLLLVDSLTGGVAHDFTLTGGASLFDSAAVCPGRVYNLVWSSGMYDSETSFSLSDIAGTTLFSDSNPSAGVLYSFTANCTLPECASVQYVSVGSVTDSTATISWTPRDATQSNFMVAYGTGTNPDSLSQVAVTGTTTTLTGLSLATTYNVFVKAVCGTDLSSTWSEGVSFNTPICSQDDQCYITIYMNDSYGDGWNGGSLSVVDSLTGITVGNFTIDDGSSAVDSAAVCIGRTYNLVWNTGSFGSEVSFAVINTALDTVLSATYPSGGFLTSFVASCLEPALPLTITLATANAAMGTTNPAPGTYTYFEGDTITISAVEYNHYDFAYWSLTYGTMTYSDTNATVSMVVLPAMAGLSATVTANFEPETYTVTATPNNSVHGTVTGGGAYQYGDTVTLVATANATSHFVSWSDGALTTTRQFIVVSDTTLVANFAYNPVSLTVANSDTTMGSVLPAPGVYQYNVGDTVTVSATASTGYSFDDWSMTVGTTHNTVTTNPYSFVVPASYAGITASITANWEVNYYTITALSNDTALGTVTGGGSYAYNTTATLQATANTNCHFVQWNDGNTNATRTVTVTGDATYTATFAYDSVTVILAVNDAAMGSVTPAAGSYTYAVGDTVTAQAVANSGYQFMSWTVRTDDYATITDNPISQVIPAAYAGMTVTYTAQFAYDTITVVLAVNDAAMGSVNPAPGTYSFVMGDTLNVEATPSIGYEFVGWSVDNDASVSIVDNPLMQVFTADQAGQTITYTANFQQSQQYNVTLSVVDSLGNANVGGSVSGDGAYYPGTEVTITATPAYGYHFVSWTTPEGQLVSNDTVYTFVMGERDVAFVATFAQNASEPIGIDDTEFSNIVIFSHGDRIVVRGAENQTIRVFDVVGRLVAQRSDAAEEESIQLTNTGVYLVKVGNAPARRVVIRR